MDNKPNPEITLAQWQTCVEMANSISQRRDTMNNLFVTLNLSILAAVAFAWNIKSILLLVAGISICVLWLFFINNYRILNAGKFEIINRIEQQLPFTPFCSEWEILKGNKKYREGTLLERWLPGLFIVLYAVSLVILLTSHFCDGGAC